MCVHHQKPPGLINEASREVPQTVKWPLEAGAKSASIPPQTRLFKVFSFGGEITMFIASYKNWVSLHYSDGDFCTIITTNTLLGSGILLTFFFF